MAAADGWVNCAVSANSAKPKTEQERKDGVNWRTQHGYVLKMSFCARGPDTEDHAPCDCIYMTLSWAWGRTWREGAGGAGVTHMFHAGAGALRPEQRSCFPEGLRTLR